MAVDTRVDVRGYGVDVRGYVVDVRGCGVDVRGCGVDVRGYGPHYRDPAPSHRPKISPVYLIQHPSRPTFASLRENRPAESLIIR
eukprot:8399682-Pyramimonas_sp.AAC.1